MGIMDTIRARHSVRDYEGKPIEGSKLYMLRSLVDDVAARSGLDIQLVRDNPEVFNIVARFGLVRGASTHIAFLAKGSESDEAIGYWGQRIALAVQEMGLNTCWVAIMACKKSKAKFTDGKKIRVGMAVGYGKTQGKPRKTKPVSELSVVESAPAPAWFSTAMEAAQLAPTAMNNQNFRITLRADGKTVKAEATKTGGWNMIDLGIVKRNFEEAANECKADWAWEE